MSRLQNTKGELRKLWLACLNHKKLVFMVALTIVVIIALSLWITRSNSSIARTESYKTVQGEAGLEVTIDYACTSSCNQKYNFNVYIFHEDGQQVSALRPDRDGKVQLATSEGNYIMLIGKQVGKDKLFPQEPLVLKSGQLLDLKLHY